MVLLQFFRFICCISFVIITVIYSFHIDITIMDIVCKCRSQKVLYFDIPDRTARKNVFFYNTLYLISYASAHMESEVYALFFCVNIITLFRTECHNGFNVAQ